MTSQTFTGSEPSSISPFSSGSSLDDEQSFHSKYIHEKEKNRKLHEKLTGYRTVANQFSKEVEEKAKLKDQVVSLRKQLEDIKLLQLQQHTTHGAANDETTLVQEHDQVFTELDHIPRSGTSSKLTSSSSASFVVLDQHGNERKPLNSKGVSPISPSTAHETCTKQEASPAHKVNRKDSIEYPQTGELSCSQRGSQTKSTNAPQAVPKQQTALQCQMQENLSQQRDSGNNFQQKPDNFRLQESSKPTGTSSLPNNCPTQLPTKPQCSRSFSSAPGGVVSITAWAGQPVKPMWQMSQESLNRSQANTVHSTSPYIPSYDQDSMMSSSYMGHKQVEAVTKLDSTVQGETSKINQTAPNGTLHPNNLSSTEGQDAHIPLSSNIPLFTPKWNFTEEAWGVGARPKGSNTLNLKDAAQIMPFLTPHMPGGEALSRRADQEETLQIGNLEATTQEPHQNELTATRPSDAEPVGTSLSVPIQIEQSSFKSGPSKADLDPLETWVDVNSENLIKFSSLPPTTSDFKTVNGSEPTGKTIFNEVSLLTNPSDEQSQLVSQADSMVAVLRNGNESGISDMLYKFAESARQMEKKMQENQALIQRQQVQIQRQHSYEEEAQHLRKEYEKLKTYFDQMHFTNSQGLVSEKGWVTVEKPLQTIDTPVSESATAKKIQNLEETNTKLFQANKEWFTKWEVLRQEAQNEKVEMESKLQSYILEMDKLRTDVLAIENQLKEAVAARQDTFQINLDLEQGKVNLLKKVENLKAQNETLKSEKRHLEGECAACKATASKLKGSEKAEKTNSELRSEINMLKQQLIVFQEDFQKERGDRTRTEQKMEKLRKEREALKAEIISKTKKTHAMLKTKDEDIKQKAKQLAELQYQVDELKQMNKQRQHIRETKGIPATAVKPTNSFYPNGMTAPTHVRQNQVAVPGLSHTYPLTRPAPEPYTQGQPTSNLSPEHLPGAWQCSMCTYINFPERSVCDICGWQNVQGNQVAQNSETLSGRPELKSRGQLQSFGLDVPDVVPDTEVEEDKAE